MEVKKTDMGKIRRQEVHVFVDNPDGPREYVHPICDLAMPTPDGKFFLVRDLTHYKETPGRKGDSFDVFYPTDRVVRVEVSSHFYYILPSGERGEKVLDMDSEVGKIIQ